MIKLCSLKQQQKDGEATSNKPAIQKRTSAAELRITRDINELNLPKTFDVEFPEQDGHLNFNLVICQSFYRNERFMVSFRASPIYPHEPPQVKCDTIVHRPNRDMDGNLFNLLKTCQMEFPSPDDRLNFKLDICPEESLYRNGRFMFSFHKSPNYPHEPPKHPNTDLDGDVCLNISGDDRKPVRAANSIV
ncbi:hypothetical protein HPB50_024824 [Hyalomma asiaticum]|uniref:Uncharacterized protein n=1 Tax=Hyalomma asiaticum TaxID=266040 RepID=A0ACB7TN75_HYAAI|nr:hypothetical protein HPB50_024824 [Hyalomma asiaticum]